MADKIYSSSFPGQSGKNAELKWDGSCLGRWSEAKVTHQVKSGQKLYVQLQLGLGNIIAMVKYIRNPYPCLIDELKPYFGLVKQGTHWLKRGKTVVILIKIKYRGMDIIENISLITFINNSCDDKAQTIIRKYPELLQSIRQIFVFRLITGVKNNNNGSIIINFHDPTDSRNGRCYGVSVDELSCVDSAGTAELSSNIFNEWFNNDFPHLTKEVRLHTWILLTIAGALIARLVLAF